MTNSTKSFLIAVIEDTIELLPRTLKHCWKEVLFVFILLEPANQYFMSFKEIYKGNSQAEFISSMGTLMISLTSGMILIFLIPLRAHEVHHNIPKRGLFAFAGEHAIAFIIEGLKMFGLVLIGTLFFIIPGIYLYMRYFLNAFVIMFDESYYKEEKSALKESYEMTRNHVFLIFVIISGLGILSFFSETFKSSFNPFIDFNPIWLVAFALNIALALLSYTAMYVIYYQLQARRRPADRVTQEGQNEINIQME